MAEQKVYYIRHKINKQYEADEQCIIGKLEEYNRIAIFYGNCDGLQDKKEFTGPLLEKFKKSPKYKTAVEYFWKLRDDGGLVAIQYQDKPQIIIGKINPGTEIEAITNPVYNTSEASDGWRNEEFIQMTLEYKPDRTLEYAEYPLLAAIQPMYGTICEPSALFFKEVIPAIVANKKIELKRELLHPKILEQLCVEYLYKIGVNGDKLDYCTLRPGKSMATIDIAGVMKSSKKLFAQVKANNISKEASKSFIEFVEQDNKNSLNIIFSAEKKSPYKEKSVVDKKALADKNIMHIDVDDVFDYFLKDKPNMIKNMIGIDDSLFKLGSFS